MHFFSVIFLTLSANIDCFILGLSYSIKNIQISLFKNLLIASLTTLGTFISMKAGHFLLKIISIDIANHIGSLFMIVIGLMMLSKKSQSDIKLTHQHLSWMETCFLGFTLSLNNIGLCLGASITGLPYISTCLLTFVFSVLFIALAQALRGSSFLIQIQSYAPKMASIMILCLGFYEFIV